MKTGLIAFPFAYLQSFLHVNMLEAIVLHLGCFVVQDLVCVRMLMGALAFLHAAGKWATPGIITSTTKIH